MGWSTFAGYNADFAIALASAVVIYSSVLKISPCSRLTGDLGFQTQDICSIRKTKQKMKFNLRVFARKGRKKGKQERREGGRKGGIKGGREGRREGGREGGRGKDFK